MNKQNKILNVDFSEQFSKDYKRFGLYVNAQRSLPNILDGLKPSQRRILYTLYKNKVFSTESYKSSAKIIGDTLGNYHPHNLDALYGTAVRLTKNWVLPAPLIKGKGNFGNISGADAASYRYTEIKLSEIGDLIVEHLSPEIVNYNPTYDNENIEPEVLPTPIPLLLINGSEGIGVGLTVKIPPHNPRFVNEAFIKYIKNQNISIEELVSILRGPDFPTSGYILNKNIIDFYKNSEGVFYLKGKTIIEKNKVIITEVPFTLTDKVKDFSNKISENIRDGKIKLAKSCENYTNKNGIRIEVTAKSGESVFELEKELYAKTKLQDTYNAVFVVLVNGKPQKITLETYFEHFLNFRRKTEKQKALYQKNKLDIVLEKKEGLICAFDNLPVIIELIKNSKTNKDIIETLTKGVVKDNVFTTIKNKKIASNFNFTEIQADVILNTPLKSISKINKEQIEKEITKLKKDIKKLLKIIQSPKELDKLIIQQTLEINKHYFPEKQFTIISNEELTEYTEVDKIIESEISVDKYGYLRKLAIGSKEAQNEVYRNKFINKEKISFFTTKGTCVSIKISDLKQHTLRENGDSLAKLGDLELNEYILFDDTIIPYNKFETSNLLQVTDSGYIRLISMKDLISNRKKIASYPLLKNENIIFTKVLNDEKKIILSTKNKKEIILDSKDISISKKTTKGTKVSLEKQDLIESVILQ